MDDPKLIGELIDKKINKANAISAYTEKISNFFTLKIKIIVGLVILIVLGITAFIFADRYIPTSIIEKSTKITQDLIDKNTEKNTKALQLQIDTLNNEIKSLHDKQDVLNDRLDGIRKKRKAIKAPISVQETIERLQRSGYEVYSK